ncbi:L-fucose:H+ symporter permease [Pedobacter xixiisoli]|uniref:MFS transporter, FHS family, L-fucose permease n=1 Tax=Pedobacter xixiisoli TaxID=1476464 RepID=A0A285ZR61_9SPHI|nr:L-fucose:H+ symporter permease [Pedobacter xixiisoli]SOD12108.1 MFS transporter, FHS family, L-fucose permease [Pedobacter xixiisoli]
MNLSNQSLTEQDVSTTVSRKQYLFPLILITSLFFFWGLVHNIDPTLIAHLKKTFTLSNLESSLVDFSVFIAYFVMAIPAGLMMKKWGYKSGIVFGLLLFACGAFLFIPAANTHQYVYFLGALFVVASGLAFLETAANPYVTVLGPPETSSFRLNMAQSFNGIAASIAPLIGKHTILTNTDVTTEHIQQMDVATKAKFIEEASNSVKAPFIVLGIIILIVAVIFIFLKLPEIKEQKNTAKEKTIWQIFAIKHTRWAVIAQFFYVGAQICFSSFFLVYAEKAAGLDNHSSSDYLIAYGALFMIGRIVGTVFMKFVEAPRLLTLYTIIAILLTIVAIFGSGTYTIYCLLGIGFFISIMFPTIFALGVKDLGEDTKTASSLIIMSIVGGAIIPLALGYVADVTHNIQYGYSVPLICLFVVLYFAYKGYKPSVNK